MEVRVFGDKARKRPDYTMPLWLPHLPHPSTTQRSTLINSTSAPREREQNLPVSVLAAA